MTKKTKSMLKNKVILLWIVQITITFSYNYKINKKLKEKISN